MTTAHRLADGVIGLSAGLAWLPHSRTLLAADIHLGYEDAVGAALPLWSTQESIETLLSAITRMGAHELILLGDIVHGTQLSEGAVRSLRAHLTRLRNAVDLLLIAGNHEGRSGGAAILGETVRAVERDHWYLTHGDEPTVPSMRCIIGHLHPSIPLAGRVTIPAFLATSSFIVIPALTPYSRGLDVTSRDCAHALARWSIAADEMQLVGVSTEKLYPFGKLARFRQLR